MGGARRLLRAARGGGIAQLDRLGRKRRLKPIAGLGVALACVAAAVSVSSPGAGAAAPLSGSTGVVTGEALPTVQTDGIVWSVQIVGNVVYAGGRFDHARPAGTDPGDPAEVERHNILAFDLTTGALLPFAPDIQGQVYTSTTKPDAFCKTVGTNTYNCDSVFRIKVTPDGSRIYVGGDFATVNGKSRQRIAAFNTSDGSLVESFKPALNGRVRALAVTNDTVYAGGSFTTVNGTVSRSRLAAFDPSGAVKDWAPVADKAVWSMNALPALNRVFIGGYFDTMNGETIHGLNAVDATTGANVAWATRAVSLSSVVTDIVNDGTAIYASGYNYNGSAGSGRFEGRMAVDAATGVVRWIDGCYGDTQAVTVMNGIVYSASHSHDCTYMNSFPQPNPVNYQRLVAETAAVGNTYQGSGTTLVANGAPIPSMIHWLPDLNGGLTTSAWKNGPWSLDNNGTYLVVGGEFTLVNGQAQQSLTRFAVPPVGQKTQAPRSFATPTATVQSDGTVRIAFTPTYDRDSATLKYELLRSDNTTTPIATANIRSTWWDVGQQTFVDRTLTAGASATYKLRVSDAEGNSTSTLWSTAVTGTATAPALSRYAKLVLADKPAAYWRLGQTSGTLLDTAAGDDLTRQNGATNGGTGVVVDESDTATAFNGNSNGYASNSTSRYGAESVSVETWFKTTTNRGGELLGWGSSRTGNSGNSDRKLYMDNSGKLYFGVNPGVRKVVSSTGTYRDGQWHHVVGTIGADGLTLYVDGQQVAQDTTVTQAQYTTSGYWRVGGDNMSGWTSQPSSGYFAGTLDEAAVYNTALTAAQVAKHFASKEPTAPTADITVAATGLKVGVDGSASSSPNGDITSYAWNFGDGATATGATASHTYGAAGTYTVSLTIKDTANKTATTTVPVTVVNGAPTAAFTVNCAETTCSVDGSGSSDADGSVASYAWTFGDGGTATGATASHTYATAGAYDVTLTVTDNAGATGTSTTSVTATAPGTVGKDGFNRTASNGWGTADAGGAWTTTSTAANYAVAGGSATITVPTAGATRQATLGSVSASDVDQTVEVSTSALPAAGSNYVYVLARSTASNTDYRARVRYMPDGTVRLAIVSRTGTATDNLIGTESVVTGLTVTPGAQLRVRFQVTGSAPTTLSAKVWSTSGAEPTAWTKQVTDATAGLQAAGAVGVATTVSASNTGVPLTATFRDYTAAVPPATR